EHTCTQRREVRGAHGGGVEDGGPVDLHAEDVGLELHQEVVGAGAAVHAQHGQRFTAVLAHGGEQVGDLQRHALERSARDVGAGGAAGETGDDAAGLGPPVRRTQSSE